MADSVSRMRAATPRSHTHVQQVARVDQQTGEVHGEAGSWSPLLALSNRAPV